LICRDAFEERLHNARPQAPKHDDETEVDHPREQKEPALDDRAFARQLRCAKPQTTRERGDYHRDLSQESVERPELLAVLFEDGLLLLEDLVGIGCVGVGHGDS